MRRRGNKAEVRRYKGLAEGRPQVGVGLGVPPHPTSGRAGRHLLPAADGPLLSLRDISPARRGNPLEGKAMARRWPLGTGGLERCSRASDARRYMDAAGVCGRGLLLQVLRFSQDLKFLC